MLTFTAREVDGRVRISVPPVQPQPTPRPFPVRRSSSDQRTVVIVGAGAAGAAAAETLRYEGFTGQIIMLSAESNLPVDRTSLSKGIGTPAEKLFLRPAEFLRDGDIEIRTGTVVKNVDVAGKVMFFGVHVSVCDCRS